MFKLGPFMIQDLFLCVFFLMLDHGRVFLNVKGTSQVLKRLFFFKKKVNYAKYDVNK